MSGSSTHAPPLRLPRRLDPPGILGAGAVPNRALVLVPPTRSSTGARTPIRGFALATQNPDARRIGSAGRPRAGRTRVPFPRQAWRRRQEELALDLLGELTRLTDEIRHANLIQLHRITAAQVDHAMADPALASAMSTLDNVSHGKRRQVLFANREYGAIVLGHRIGAYDWDELIGHLRILARNEVFKEYWEATVEHRRSVPHQSLEARVGRAVDVIMEELGEGPEEWWVVGPRPDTDPSG